MDTLIILRENLFFVTKKIMQDYLSWDLKVLKQIKRIIVLFIFLIKKLLKLLFCIDYAKTVKQILFCISEGREGGKKSFDIINKSAKFHVSQFSISQVILFLVIM